jgi:vacuolar-type H+-ATPase subunit I/STV1
MGVSKIQKVEIVAHSGVKKALLSSLQEEGVVHLEQTQTEELGLTGSSADVSDLDFRLHHLKHALDYLANYKDEKLLKKLSWIICPSWTGSSRMNRKRIT